MAEEYIKTLNAAATKIQRWFLRHRTRHHMGQAAVRRLIQQKKLEREEVQKHSLDVDRKQEDKKKTKEEKASQLRQNAIQVWLNKVKER